MRSVGAAMNPPEMPPLTSGPLRESGPQRIVMRCNEDRRIDSLSLPIWWAEGPRCSRGARVMGGVTGSPRTGYQTNSESVPWSRVAELFAFGSNHGGD